MKAVVVLAVVVAAFASGCPEPGCNGDASSKVSVSGNSCNDCTVDFGNVDVGLQEHRRFDLFFGCNLAAAVFDGPNLSTGDVFAVNQVVLPAQEGQTGFADITFTPTDTGDKTDTADFGGGFKAELHGKGVTP